MRGLAAVVMLQGHVFHSFTSNDWRLGSPYVLSQFLGGLPPAFFLFLTGITLAFLMDSSEKKGIAPPQRIVIALRRAGYLFVLAYLFRFQLWVFGWPNSPWTDLLKVDILNCMGLGLTLLAFMSAFTTIDRVRLCAVLGVAIASISPLVSSLDWTGVPDLVKQYLAPDYNHFSVFPWGSFLAFGVAAGSLLRVVPAEHNERLMQWLAVLGFALILIAHYFGNLPYSVYHQSEFWLDSPARVFIKLGVILVIMSWGYVWNVYVIKDRWNWLRQLGTTSLLVYWVHIELVYGRWFWFWKENLTVSQTLVVAAVVITLMLGLSTARSRWSKMRAWMSRPGYQPAGSSAD